MLRFRVKSQKLCCRWPKRLQKRPALVSLMDRSEKTRRNEKFRSKGGSNKIGAQFLALAQKLPEWRSDNSIFGSVTQLWVWTKKFDRK